MVIAISNPLLIILVLVLLILGVVILIKMHTIQNKNDNGKRCNVELRYPYFDHTFYVDKDTRSSQKIIEEYILSGGTDSINKHELSVRSWKSRKLKEIELSGNRRVNVQAYNDILDDEHVIRFRLIRKNKRGKIVEHETITFSFESMRDYYNKLGSYKYKER